MKKLFFLLIVLPFFVSAKGVPAVKTVSVDNVKDLFEAIAPNTTIRVAPGDYNFSSLTDGSSTEYANIYYGEVVIDGVNGLTIIGDGYVEFGTEDSYSDVLEFRNCKSIRLENLIFGHFIEKGYCEGSVLTFQNSEGISMEKCEMYGSGTYGIWSENVEGLSVNNSVIKDCSYGIMYLTGTTNIEFKNTQFKRCQAGISIRGNSRLILFDNCYFSGNKDYQDWSKWNKEAQYLFFFEASVESILLKNNRFIENGTKGMISREDDVTVKGSVGSGNAFDLQ